MKKWFALAFAVLALVFCASAACALTAELPEHFEYTITDGKTEITGLASDYQDADVVVIPDNIEECPVTSIKSDAFYDCTSLNSIIFGHTPVQIASSAFYNVTADVFYHENDAWLPKIGNYGGHLTWISLDHTPVSDGNGVPPTCTETGLSASAHCSVCGALVAEQEVLPMHSATLETDPGVPPTCTDPGLSDSAYCSACGEVFIERELLPALGHAEVVSEAVPPTCTQSGTTEGRRCSNCGEIFLAQEILPALGHTVVTDEAVSPTCTEPGLTEGMHCSVCGEVFLAQEEIEALGHTEEILEGVPPTCSATGLGVGLRCSACGEILLEQDVLPMKSHTLGEAFHIEDETCTEDARVGSICAVCGAFYDVSTVPGSALGHDFEENVVPATCVSEGMTVRRCKRCGYEEETEKTPVDPEAHSPAGETMILREATCTEKGIRYRVCELCGSPVYENYTISHVETVDPAVAPTCTETGLTAGVHCALCGEVLLAQEVVPMLRHYAVCLDAPRAAGKTDGHTGRFACAICGEEVVSTVPVSAAAVLKLPDALTTVEPEAFAGMDAQQVVLPEGLTSVGSRAFAGCGALRLVVVPDSLTALDADVFEGCGEIVYVCSAENEAFAAWAEGQGLPVYAK